VGSIDVYLEIGARRVFAVAVEWPGWARSGHDEKQAIETLLAYTDRYQTAIGEAAGLPSPSGTTVVDRIPGSATTDFGAPGAVPSLDDAPISEAALATQLRILRATWEAFDRAAADAVGLTLATGPRGGGRDLARIVFHVLEAERAYTKTVGGQVGDTTMVHDLFEAAVIARSRGELADRGPRGGKRWPPRYAIRRAAWHALDHAWELEDRTYRA
jgi:hypothetical protein